MASATAAYQQSIMWETEGDGFFVDPTKVNAVYLRGQGDVTNGSVQLKVTAYGYEPGTDITDSVVLSFSKRAIADAGSDTTINAGDDIQLNGMVENTDVLYWTTDGDGTFNDTTLADAIYTPGAGDIENGSASLWLHAVDTIPCSDEDRDRIRVFIDEPVGIFSPGQDDEGVKLRIVPNPVVDKFTYFISGLETQQATMTISNLQGQTVFTQNLFLDGGSYTSNINMSYLPKGIYIIKINSVDQAVFEKIILQ
jgi:hypothetical protein